MRNVNEQPKGNQENKIQRQKTAPRQDPIELSDMSRDKGNKAPLSIVVLKCLLASR